jgi:hypothetical protein
MYLYSQGMGEMISTTDLKQAVGNMPYEVEGLSQEAKFTYVTERRAKIQALEVEWVAWLFQEYGYGLPKEITDRVFNLAWDKEHANGYQEVETDFQELASLARIAYDAGRNSK